MPGVEKLLQSNFSINLGKFIRRAGLLVLFALLCLSYVPAQSVSAAMPGPTDVPSFTSTFGKYWQGSILSNLNGIATDASGNIFAVDTGRNRILKFDSNRNYITEWFYLVTCSGAPPSLYAIAVDQSTGDVYVASPCGSSGLQLPISKYSNSGVFIDDWSSIGSGDGQVSAPHGLAIDSSGNVYVADSSNNRIQKFDSSGNYITKWGTSGVGNGQLSSPQGLAIDSSGNVYVADSSNNRIQKFDSSGNYITKWGSSGTGDGQFTNPTDVALDSSGNVYVADTGAAGASGNKRIQKFNSSGTFIAKWGSYGTGDGQFYYAVGVEIDSSNNVYVADYSSSNARIQKFNTSGTYQSQINTGGSPQDGMTTPTDIESDSSGNTYVTDSGNDRIHKFSSDGTYLSTWGSTGTGNGQFSFPTGIAVDANNNIYVADANNNRIQKFDSSGVYQSQFGTFGTGNGQFSSPSNITIDSSGNLYVADAGNNRIQKFDSSGNYLAQWGSTGTGNGQFSAPNSIAVDSSGNLYVVDTNNNRIQKFDSSGNYLAQWGSIGQISGQFFEPNAVEVDVFGKIYTLEGINSRIQKFSYAPTTSYEFPSSPSDGSAITGVTLTVPNGTDITCANTVTESSLAAQDGSFQYPLGFVNFCFNVASGSTNEISLTFVTNLTPTQVTPRKYNSTTHTYANITNSTITETTISGSHALKLTYSITDGGVLDDDGIANGIIVDPVGLAEIPATTAASKSTTLASTGDNAELGYIVMFLLVASGFVIILRNVSRRQSSYLRVK